MAMLGHDALKAVHGKEYEVGCIPCMLYVASGGSLDWTLGEAEIPYRWTLETGDWTLDTGHWTLDTGFILLHSQLRHGIEGHRQLRFHPAPRPDHPYWRGGTKKYSAV